MYGIDNINQARLSVHVFWVWRLRCPQAMTQYEARFRRDGVAAKPLEPLPYHLRKGRKGRATLVGHKLLLVAIPLQWVLWGWSESLRVVAVQAVAELRAVGAVVGLLKSCELLFVSMQATVLIRDRAFEFVPETVTGALPS